MTTKLATSILDFLPAAGAMPEVVDTSVQSSSASPFNPTPMRSGSALFGDPHASHTSPTPRISFAPRRSSRSPTLFVHAGESGLASRTRGLAQHAV
jgi:hypothetical protein